jgi:hypothetical protein
VAWLLSFVIVTAGSEPSSPRVMFWLSVTEPAEAGGGADSRSLLLSGARGGRAAAGVNPCVLGLVWGAHLQCGVPATGVPEFDVVVDRTGELDVRLPSAPVEQLDLQAGPEALHASDPVCTRTVRHRRRRSGRCPRPDRPHEGARHYCYGGGCGRPCLRPRGMMHEVDTSRGHRAYHQRCIDAHHVLRREGLPPSAHSHRDNRRCSACVALCAHMASAPVAERDGPVVISSMSIFD